MSSHRLILFFDLLELPSLSLHSPGMGMSCMSLISASCVGVLVLTNSHLSLRTSGLSVFVRTSVGTFNELGNVSYKFPLSSCRERAWRVWIPLLTKYIFSKRYIVKTSTSKCITLTCNDDNKNNIQCNIRIYFVKKLQEKIYSCSNCMSNFICCETRIKSKRFSRIAIIWQYNYYYV